MHLQNTPQGMRILPILLLFHLSFSLCGQINTPSGAAIPFGSNNSYPGAAISPTNLPSGGAYGASQDAADAYLDWKNNFVESCGGSPTRYRVKFDNTSETVSEGIAYGMLLAAYAADQELFDGLWDYYKNFSNSHGVMNWKINGCSGIQGTGGATDAELDAAMALLVAQHQWPNTTSPHDYQADVTALIDAIKTYEIQPTNQNGPYQANNGDQWGFGNKCRNPSYQSPAYYKVFAAYNSSQTAFWNECVNASYSLLNTNAHTTTGLVSNWCDHTGTPNSCNGANDYGWDACRNPWRMGTDVMWYSDASAAVLCNKMAAWMQTKGVNNLRAPLPQNGSGGAYDNPAFIATWAVAVMGANSSYQSLLNDIYAKTVSTYIQPPSGYFGNTLRVIGLFCLTGNFWNPFNTGSSSNNPPSASFTLTPSSGTAPLAVSFDASASSDPDGDPLGYFWNFGDGNSATGAVVSHTYTAAGSFTAILTVSDGNGGTGSDSEVITIGNNGGGGGGPCDLVLQYRTTDNTQSSATDNHIRPHFQIVNQANTSISLSDLTIRYWYTKEGTSAETVHVDWAQVGSQNIVTNIVQMATPTTGADHYMEVGFTAAAGSIPANGTSGGIQTRFHKNNWSNYDETDDYSFDMSFNTYQNWDHVTLYCNGLLTWGTEPGGSNPPTNNPPTASYTLTPSSGTAPLAVSFDASASSDPDGDPLTYGWDFGDGASGSGVSASHTYTSAGSFTAVLTVDDGNGGTDTHSEVITVSSAPPTNNPPNATFTLTPSSGTAPLVVSFDALASSDPDGDPLTYAWNFGDGTSGSGVSASHTYTTVGNFTAVLTVDDGNGGTDTHSEVITVSSAPPTNSPPTASFTLTPSSGTAPLAVSFDASASSDPDGDPLSYAWDFGDGASGSGVSASHTYTSAGSFTAVLTVDDGNGGTDTHSATVAVNSSGGGGCDLVLQYRTYDNTPSSALDNHIRPHFKINNQGNTSISLSDLTIRYWYTKEGTSAETVHIDWAQVGNSNILTSIVEMATPTTGADHYLEVGFKTAAGSIPANGTSGEVQTRFHKNNWSNYDETDDYSFDMSFNTYQNWDKVTLYCNGQLAWGTEPSGSQNLVAHPSSTASAASLHSKTLASYPNPFSGHLTVETDATEIGVFDALGRLVKKIATSGQYGQVVIDLTNQPNGLYFIQAGEQTVRMVKQ